MKAFPLVTQRPDGVVVEYNSGMDLRDYFAAKAMQAVALKHSHENDVARNAYKIADAMMKAREVK